jgi:hypothetical protein
MSPGSGHAGVAEPHVNLAIGLAGQVRNGAYVVLVPQVDG